MMPPLALTSSQASWPPRCMSAAMAAKVPVNGSGNPILMTSFDWARRTAGKARPAAATALVVRNARRLIIDASTCTRLPSRASSEGRGPPGRAPL